MSWTETTTLVATCGRGCSHALQTELRAMGYAPEELTPTAIGVEGRMQDAMRLNLWLRTANRILFELAAFEIHSTDDLYDAVSSLPWEIWLRPDAPFHVHGTARHDTLRDSRFALLRCKDAIADRFIDQTGARPDSSPRAEDAAGIVLHWHDDIVRLYLDTTGTPLSHRGYRRHTWAAPLRETLAAAILMEAGWMEQPGEAFLDPLCGSGTLPIEAAWMAQRRAPGLHRKDYAFLHLHDIDSAAWRTLKAEASARYCKAPDVTLIAADIDARAIAQAEANAALAGVDNLIHFQTADFRDLTPPPPPALIVMNPEYGERMGGEDKLPGHYADIGNYLKQKASGRRAAVFTGNIPLSRKIGLRPSKRLEMWNGDIECRLLVYDLYDGTRDHRLLHKHGHSAPPADAPSY